MGTHGKKTKSAIIDELADTPAKRNRLRRDDFTLSNGTANQESKIATYEADLPLALREDAPIRIVFVVVEEFTTNATAGDSETFNLSNDLISTPNTTDVVLYENGSRVQPDSYDAANDTVTYTDDGTGNTLDVFYVARDPTKLRIEKSAPRASGQVSEEVFSDDSPVLFEKDQNKEPPKFDFDDDRPLAPVVPAQWSLDVYADGPVGYAWDDSGTATDNGAKAVNAMLEIPVRRSQDRVEELSKHVKMEAVK